ncbi:MAG: diaminopimelate epimerase [Lachnospiraceae bacterium]|nr:diaminopimelate epimerase [Lachnospiraceae bacterium]
MNFTKMHGLGNDYIYVDCTKEKLSDAAKLAVKLSDRHFGIGADGLILIKPSKIADFEMAMYNADGSRGEMCGNGIRCVGKFVYDYGLTKKTEISIETLAGIKHLSLKLKDDKVKEVKVDMGEPILEACRVPVRSDHKQAIEEPITIGNREFKMTCVSMGNPHAVVPVGDVDTFKVEKFGPLFETDYVFPQRVNTEFINVIDSKHIKMRVWERGSGETFACGTGACAVAVACALNGWTERAVTVELLGGKLSIRWNKRDNHVYMTGPAEIVYEGSIEV